jgi:hypothetical protein
VSGLICTSLRRDRIDRRAHPSDERVHLSDEHARMGDECVHDNDTRVRRTELPHG